MTSHNTQPAQAIAGALPAPNTHIAVQARDTGGVLITTTEYIPPEGVPVLEGQLAELMGVGPATADMYWTREELPSGKVVFLELLTDCATSGIPLPIEVLAREGFTVAMAANELVASPEDGGDDD